MSHDERLAPVDALLAEYLEALRSGRRADCDALLAEHLEHARELSAFLDDYERVDGKFAALRQLAGSTPCSAAETPTLRHGDTAVPPPPSVGSSFGDYELLSEVARGGMGVVYKARQKSLNRIVALKMVLGGNRNPSLDRDRFLVEARAVARLNHPHIVPIYEVGEQAGQPYFTMEFFTGGSLRDQIEALRADQPAIARLMVTIARAVEHAHRRGILHRDLKPTNVLLDERREPRVTDFGLAKRLDEESDLTQAGVIVGTPSYMAPEQANAQTDLTTAVDVYGLGALMYELLTGRPPFKGDTPMETMLTVLSAEPPRPRKLAPDIAPDMETICLKCLDKNPLARYGSADALADDLDRWLAGKPIAARRIMASERLVKWSRRQPLLAGSLATVAAALLGLLLLAGFLWQNAELRAQAVQDLSEAKVELAQVDGERKQVEAKKSKAEKLAEEQRKLADAQKALADKIAAEVRQLETAADAAEKQLAYAQHEARHTTYAADMQLAHAAWQGDNISTTRELLDRYRNSVGVEDLRGVEWHYLDRQLHGARLSWRAVTEEKNALGSIVGMAISPDGKTLATAQVGSSAKLWNLADGKLLQTMETKKSTINGMSFTNFTGMFFEDEGRNLVAVVRKGFDARQIEKVLIDLAARKEPFKIESLADSLEFQVCSLTDDVAVRVEPFDAGRLRTAVFPLLAGALFIIDEGNFMMVMTMDASPDGNFVALAGTATKNAGDVNRVGGFSGGRIIIWDVKNAKVHAQQTSPTPITAVAFSPVGDALAIGTSDGAVGVGKTDLAQPPRMMLGHTAYIYSLRFSGDGSRLASGALDSLVMLWDVATAKEVNRFRGHTAAVMRVEFSPNAKSLVSGSTDATVKVWDLERTSPLVVLRGHETSVGSLAFTGEGGELASVDLRGNLKTWRLADGHLLRSANVKDENTLAVRMSSTGKTIAIQQGVGDSLLVRDVASGKETTLSWKDHVPYQPVISPDDKLLAACDLHGKGLCIWNIADGKLVATLDDLKGMAMGLTFSSENKLLVAAHGTGAIVWDWQASKTPRILKSKDEGTTAVALSADNRFIAVAASSTLRRGESTVRIWDLEADQLRTEFVGAGQSVQQLAFSPDGRRLATGGTSSGRRGLLKLWDTASGREVFSAHLPPANVTTIAFSPNGRRMAAGLTNFDITAALTTTGRQLPSDILVWDATPVE